MKLFLDRQCCLRATKFLPFTILSRKKPTPTTIKMHSVVQLIYLSFCCFFINIRDHVWNYLLKQSKFIRAPVPTHRQPRKT